MKFERLLYGNIRFLKFNCEQRPLVDLLGYCETTGLFWNPNLMIIITISGVNFTGTETKNVCVGAGPESAPPAMCASNLLKRSGFVQMNQRLLNWLPVNYYSRSSWNE